MRLIDADMLLKEIENIYSQAWAGRDFAEIVQQQPTIKAEPVKHGTWERIDGKIHGYVCSICEYGICTGKPPYCPQCGARLDGDKT